MIFTAVTVLSGQGTMRNVVPASLNSRQLISQLHWN